MSGQSQGGRARISRVICGLILIVHLLDIRGIQQQNIEYVHNSSGEQSGYRNRISDKKWVTVLKFLLLHIMLATSKKMMRPMDAKCESTRKVDTTISPVVFTSWQYSACGGNERCLCTYEMCCFLVCWTCRIWSCANPVLSEA